MNVTEKKTATAILRLPEVMARTGASRSWIYQSAKNGSFPKPIKIGPRYSGWVEEEVEEFLGSQIRASRVGSDCE